MPRYRLAALALSAMACIASAQSLTKAVPIESSVQGLSESDPVSWARPRVVVPPDYPVRAANTKTTGYVDVDLLVAENGSVGEIRSMSSTPKSDEFESAVREVIKLWTFHAARSNCRPYETVGNVRIWFDMKGDAGVVSVSNRTPPPVPAAEPGPPKSKIASPNAAAVRAAIRYPRRARRGNAQGEVSVKLTVEPTGSVSSVDIAYARSTPPGYEADFTDVSKAAAALIKMDPMPDRDKPVTVCIPFAFALR